MTLLLTWVVPDGIVMGADSALTFSEGNKTTMTLADAHKIIPYDRDGTQFGVSFYGLAKINKEWTSNWLQHYADHCQVPQTIESFAQQLSADLNGLGIQDSEALGMHIAGWEIVARSEEGIEPRFFEVTNGDPLTRKIRPYFAARDILGAEFLSDIRKYRAGEKAIYPMRFGTAGIPSNFSTEWIDKTFIPAHTKMLGMQIPRPHITSVAEYVRFLIGMVADTQRIARQDATVNRPIETMILFPDFKRVISLRY